EQPLDVPATVRNALLRGGRPASGTAVKLSASDFEVAETERRSAAVVSLLVDLSYSMQLRGTWAAAKQTALALHALLRSRFPQDAIQVIGFSNYARELRETELGHGAGHQPASRAAAGRAPYRPAPGARAGRLDRDRRRANGPPAAGRAVLVRLAAVSRDGRAHPGRGGQDDPPARRAEHFHAGG